MKKKTPLSTLSLLPGGFSHSLRKMIVSSTYHYVLNFLLHFHLHIFFSIKGDFMYSEMLMNILFTFQKILLQCHVHLYNNNNQSTYLKYISKYSIFGDILILIRNRAKEVTEGTLTLSNLLPSGF